MKLVHHIEVKMKNKEKKESDMIHKHNYRHGEWGVENNQVQKFEFCYPAQE